MATAEKSVIERVLSLDLPIAEAPGALAAIASDHKLSGLDDKLEQFKVRTEALGASAHKSVMEGARFATRFGRRFTYYDGFVFEVVADAAANAPFIAGGRYDSLLRDLSAGEVDATGLGGIVIPHRMPTKMGAA